MEVKGSFHRCSAPDTESYCNKTGAECSQTGKFSEFSGKVIVCCCNDIDNCNGAKKIDFTLYIFTSFVYCLLYIGIFCTF